MAAEGGEGGVRGEGGVGGEGRVGTSLFTLHHMILIVACIFNEYIVCYLSVQFTEHFSSLPVFDSMCM